MFPMIHLLLMFRGPHSSLSVHTRYYGQGLSQHFKNGCVKQQFQKEILPIQI